MPATMSYLSLAGRRYGEPPKHGMIERAHAARQADLDSIGVSLAEDLDPHVLDYVHVPELEWVDLGAPVTPVTLDRVRRYAGALGSTRLNVGVCHRGPLNWDATVNRIRKLARGIAPVTVAVEPVAFGTLHDVWDVMSLIEDADEPNVGLLFDMWHVYRDSPGWQNPAGLVDRIAEIQLCGVQRVHGHDPKDVFEASQNRPLMSDSVPDIGRWLARLRAAGCDAPLSYEVPNDRHHRMSCADVADDAAADLRKVGGA